MLSISVTLCALVPCSGIAPYTGARLQCMSVAGASSTSFACGKCGVLRIRCVGGGCCPCLPPLRSVRSLPSCSLSFPDSRFSSLPSRGSRSRSLSVAGEPDRWFRGVATPPAVLSPLVDLAVPDLVSPEGVLWPAADGVREGAPPTAPVLLRDVVLVAGLNVVAEPVTAWWK